MRTNTFTASLKAAVGAVCALTILSIGAFGQQQVNLTAAPTTANLPDGSAVPMWGYSCAGPTTISSSLATCASLNKTASGWSPVLITIPFGQDLTVNLTNSLSFSNSITVPTSLVIVGQLGGGLGTTANAVAGPAHNGQTSTTWSTVTGATFTPPAQGPRVQSFSSEVAPGVTTALTWTKPRAGTYLIESGTHPSIQGPMGLYGILVVTAAPAAISSTNTAATAGLAYPGVPYDADVPLLLSEIDPVQNRAVSAAVNTAGFTETAVWSGQPGGCGNPSSGAGVYQTCYPPAVNYSPLYYMFNGVAFDKTNPSASTFSATLPAVCATGTPTGQILVRFVNAGLRMHVPSIVGSLTTGTNASGAPTTTAGFSLIAEDGNPLPGVHRVQSEVFLAAGKTYDVMINGPAPGASALPVFDRQLSLSGNGIGRDTGMLAYLSVNGAAAPQAASLGGAVANADTYNSVVAGKSLSVSDTSRGLIANDVNVYGVAAVTQPKNGTLTLSANGTFIYVPDATWALATGATTSDSFTYQANGNSNLTAVVTLAACTQSSGCLETAGGITVNPITYTSNLATSLTIRSPGVLSVDSDGKGYPLTVAVSSVTPQTGLTVAMDARGGFNASVPAPGTYTFTYLAQNSQGTQSASPATVTLVFPTGSGLSVNVVDGSDKTTAIADYRWLIEEDRTFFVDPNNTTNTSTTGGTTASTFGTNFHTSYMPLIAQGCTGAISCESGQSVNGSPVACDIGDGVCRPGSQKTVVTPDQVVLDPTKRYYISVLPGDAANPFNTNNKQKGHGMGGAPIAAGATSVKVLTQPTPLQPSKLTVFVYEDDDPLNGEQDAGGGVDILAPNEPGLGGFNITIFDAAGGPGDSTGQLTYDMFNMPLSNSLAGTKDPVNGNDACPISKTPFGSRTGTVTNNGVTTTDATQTGITGTIVTCPKYESDGKTLSPLAGQAVIANMMPGRFGVVATPAADRIARGEEWLQTNTLDGQKAHDAFLKVGEPAFFQEYGPASFHVAIGFANPKIINSRLNSVCNGTNLNVTGKNCANTVTGKVTTERMSRTPDERLYSSGSRDSFAFTQCYVSFGDPDGIDFAFTKCAADGTFSLAGLPDGDWRVTTFDQWNDQLVDGLSWPVRLGGSKTNNMGDLAANQWQANLYTRTFIDDNKDGVSSSTEGGIPLIPVSVRYRDGSLANNLTTDFKGNANFNETFPLFNWYVVESDTTRYKTTGTHVVYDAGGPADGTSCGGGYPNCGKSAIGKNMANTVETVSVPAALRIPGAVYCDKADCTGFDIKNGPKSSASTGLSTGRIDPPWVGVEGWQGFSGQNSFIEFGKTPYAAGENGGIKGHVVYASTRPFDDPQMLVQAQWEPLVPHVTMNLYKEGTAPDGSQSLTLVDTTQTSSFDDWAQGFRSDGMPNMSCPGQITSDLFYFSLYNQPNYLNLYNSQHSQGNLVTLPNNSQFKCYDGMHNWNQIQPAPYDGMYKFPSVLGLDPVTGAATGSNCSMCIVNPTDGTTMLPPGKYVVEVVVPPGYELVKEEDKNILIGDNFIAPVTQEFGSLTNIFILPDQASVAASYNANNPNNPTTDLGAVPINQNVPSFSVEPVWACVGESRTVPDFISLFPRSGEVAPFAGSTRNLCDRKEVTLGDQASAIAKFYIFTSTHAAAHFTGVITDDFTSEFDPFSPQFGEKFAPPDLPVSVKDWAGNEVNRVYADHWGAYNGLNYSTWEVNPPNPTGYSPTMMIMCMNDPGAGATPDPLFNPGYSQFCYELPFMPGQTQYMDTPVTPTSAFSEGYNHPDCAYPAATPAISEVDGDAIGPWVSAAGNTLTIKALGDLQVINNGYSGPSAGTAPFNQKTVPRHYGFGTAQGTVTIGGVAATVTSWGDGQITVTVPTGVPTCGITPQQKQYGGSVALCGELLITAANGKKSIDTVTVTIGGKAPTHANPTSTLQAAIDAAAPGDLIILDPGVYNEIVLMWKPVRLQGVGAASSVLNANTHPAGKLDPWRQHVNCLFGLALNGQPYTAAGGSNVFDSAGSQSCPATGWAYFGGGPNNPQVDRLPLEGILGWDTTVNGNLAQLLQEPTLMGAYEGAGITVLSKGVKIPAGSANPFGSGSESAFPTGTKLLTKSDCGDGKGQTNAFPSNFLCNPSSIDGLSITNSSQGGGGIFVHAWGHNLQIANNRVYNNSGTLTGGITIGQGESPDAYLKGTVSDSDPGSCQNNGIKNTQLPYCFDTNVNVHNNSVTLNSSIGDELYSSTPAGGGGVTFCTGADYYKFNNNWVCGNLSTGDGGGLVHLGFIYNGDIESNQILFNQSTNPTVPTNGGGIIVMGAPPDGLTASGLECGNTAADADCAPGLSDGTGPGLVINANLIMGNAAESGSGGGLRFQGVNGTEVVNFPVLPSQWNSVTVTNNIIANNLAGWDGAGVSLQDALVVNLINNTIVSNDTTASSGVLFNTLGAPIASSSGPTCTTSCGTASAPQPAGLVAIQNSAVLMSTMPKNIVCPLGHAVGLALLNGACRNMSYPLLYNDVFWQNRAFYIGVGSLSPQYQQNIVSLYNAFGTTAAANQPSADAVTANGNGVVVSGGTGACTTASYWDVGVRGDTGPKDHSSQVKLAPMFSVLTDTTGYDGSNTLKNPTVVSQYCNGSRTPPEFASGGFQVPPGISDATVPNPIFNLTPNATVDEGNNWINISWGPLAMTNPTSGAVLGNYAPAAGSPVIDYIPRFSIGGMIAPATDFYGTPRSGAIDVGAVEYVAPPTVTTLTPNMGYTGSTLTVTLTGTNLSTASAVSAPGINVVSFNVVNASTIKAVFAIPVSAQAGPTSVTVTTLGGISSGVTFTVATAPALPTLTGITPASVKRGSGTVTVTLTGTGLTGATAVNIAPPQGIALVGFTIVSDTTVTANLVIGSNATNTAPRAVSVKTPGGLSNTVSFTVTK